MSIHHFLNIFQDVIRIISMEGRPSAKANLGFHIPGTAAPAQHETVKSSLSITATTSAKEEEEEEEEEEDDDDDDDDDKAARERDAASCAFASAVVTSGGSGTGRCAIQCICICICIKPFTLALPRVGLYNNCPLSITTYS